MTQHRPRSPRRRAVASVLAMMFLVIFGALAATMAVVEAESGDVLAAEARRHSAERIAMGAARDWLTGTSGQAVEAMASRVL